MKSGLAQTSFKQPERAVFLPSVEEVEIVWEIKAQDPVVASAILFELYGQHLSLMIEETSASAHAIGDKIRQQAEHNLILNIAPRER